MLEWPENITGISFYSTKNTKTKSNKSNITKRLSTFWLFSAPLSSSSRLNNNKVSIFKIRTKRKKKWYPFEKTTRICRPEKIPAPEKQEQKVPENKKKVRVGDKRKLKKWEMFWCSSVEKTKKMLLKMASILHYISQTTHFLSPASCSPPPESLF